MPLVRSSSVAIPAWRSSLTELANHEDHADSKSNAVFLAHDAMRSLARVFTADSNAAAAAIRAVRMVEL